ncbi:DUF2007 domain-containing protein [Chitinophaga pendula]|uniref:putative signal transducing protein n=1 Tax=Chitinophaga TaxID=79328 RepID=UPI000BB0AF96|nr:MULTISPECIES: DUF2007 domain-containing protein [Chitinophaga]ASZ10284.1 hypothetical protein CK934_04460 [Chitinophaga sp. MD30]UCJ06754.1 DUF2007 domain-containing protein [Chitinophaga pendula]
MEKDWVKVFESNQPFRAEVVKGLLLEHGINAVLVNKQDSSYMIALPGLAEIYVHISQQVEAIRLMAASEGGEESEQA